MPSGGQNTIDLHNQRFGKLVVISRAASSPRGLAIWRCKCDCGKIIKISGYYLRQGRSKSCGCQNSRLCGEQNPRWSGYKNISGSYWHRIRQGAKQRSLALIITIKDAWNQYVKQDGKCALSGLSIQLCPSDRRRRANLSEQTASLDRIDSSKGYIETNIQWVHKDINKIKMNLDQDYFIDLCLKVAQNVKSKETVR